MTKVQTLPFLPEVWAAGGGDPRALESLSVIGDGGLSSMFAVTDLAASSVGAAGLAAAALIAARHGGTAGVTVDRRLASFWFGWSLRPDGWSLPPPWDPVAGDYRTADGWIRLHTNAPHHRRAALEVLGVPAEKEKVARAVASWTRDDLESAIVARGGCAAAMRSAADWAAHPQGRAVAAEPLLQWSHADPTTPPVWNVPRARPLQGIRVLDLTRVLAGPVATRFLAGLGADVLRIDPPDWDEPGVVPDVTLGKRCARLDLRSVDGRACFERLLAGADILVHGYRPEALDGLGFDEKSRRQRNPGLIDMSLDAYGWSGPWRGRRGFDSLVQMSSGIAEAGMRWRGVDRPVPLPVQALDHAAGYILATAALLGLTRRLQTGAGSGAKTSLARVAALLIAAGPTGEEKPLSPETADDLAADLEVTAWGPVRRVKAPVSIEGAPLSWDRPAEPLGASRAAW